MSAMAEENAQKTARASLHFHTIAPRKMRMVVDLIRGRPVEDALLALRFCRRGGAPVVAKLLRSAVANAESKDLDVDRLRVTLAFVDGGPVLKRFRPMPQGRAGRIRKRTSHVVVQLTEV